jgi:hypothetical protein
MPGQCRTDPARAGNAVGNRYAEVKVRWLRRNLPTIRDRQIEPRWHLSGAGFEPRVAGAHNEEKQSAPRAKRKLACCGVGFSG